MGVGRPTLVEVTKVGGIDDTIWLTPSPAAGRKDPRRRRSRGARIVLVALVLLVVFGATSSITLAVLSRKDYGTLAFWKLPARIDFCGRRYYDNGSHAENPESLRSQNAGSSARWTLLSRTFSGRPIYADVSAVRPPSQSVCTMELFIPTGGGRWEAYALSGGP